MPVKNITGEFVIMLQWIACKLTLLYHCTAPGLSFFETNVRSCVYKFHSTCSQFLLLMSRMMIRKGVLILLLLWRIWFSYIWSYLTSRLNLICLIHPVTRIFLQYGRNLKTVYFKNKCLSDFQSDGWPLKSLMPVSKISITDGWSSLVTRWCKAFVTDI